MYDFVCLLLDLQGQNLVEKIKQFKWQTIINIHTNSACIQCNWSTRSWHWCDGCIINFDRIQTKSNFRWMVIRRLLQDFSCSFTIAWPKEKSIIKNRFKVIWKKKNLPISIKHRKNRMFRHKFNLMDIWYKKILWEKNIIRRSLSCFYIPYKYLLKFENFSLHLEQQTMKNRVKMI
jgi:hypothetical protein